MGFSFNIFFIQIFAEKIEKLDQEAINRIEEYGKDAFLTAKDFEKYTTKDFEDYFNHALTYRSESSVPIMPHDFIGFQKPGSLDMATIICVHNDIYYLLFSILFLVC
jgi:hypothetical protein